MCPPHLPQSHVTKTDSTLTRESGRNPGAEWGPDGRRGMKNTSVLLRGALEGRPCSSTSTVSRTSSARPSKGERHDGHTRRVAGRCACHSNDEPGARRVASVGTDVSSCRRSAVAS